MSLINELGARYCDEMLHGSGFLYEGQAFSFGRVLDQDSVSVVRLGTNPAKPLRQVETIPSEFFSSWGTFAHPTLGYRSSGDGQVLGTYSRINSTRRGLSGNTIHVDMHESTLQLFHDAQFDLHSHLHESGKIISVFVPQYVPFAKGLADIMAGKILNFAVSADFAVAPSDATSFLDILFRGRKVGEITEDGKVTITVPNINFSWDRVTKEA